MESQSYFKWKDALLILMAVGNNDNLISSWFHKSKAVFYSFPEIMTHFFLIVKYNVTNEANTAKTAISLLFI